MQVDRTPGKAVRAFCEECVGSIHDIQRCGGNKCKNGGADERGICWFYPYRMGKGRPSVKIVRQICLWCQGDRADFVRECETGSCVLYPYRFGKNPNRKGQGRLENLLQGVA